MNQSGNYSQGRLVKVSNKFISDPIDNSYNLSNQYIPAISSESEESLVSIWRKNGFHYTPDEASRIRQVLVEFSHTFNNNNNSYNSSNNSNNNRNRAERKHATTGTQVRDQRVYSYPGKRKTYTVLSCIF